MSIETSTLFSGDSNSTKSASNFKDVDAYLNQLIEYTLTESKGEQPQEVESITSVLLHDVRGLAENLREYTNTKDSLQKGDSTQLDEEIENSSLSTQVLNIFSQFTSILGTTSVLMTNFPAADHTVLVKAVEMLQNVIQEYNFEGDVGQSSGFDISSLADFNISASQEMFNLYNARYELLNAEHAVIKAKAEYNEAFKQLQTANAEAATFVALSETMNEALDGEVTPEGDVISEGLSTGIQSDITVESTKLPTSPATTVRETPTPSPASTQEETTSTASFDDSSSNEEIHDIDPEGPTNIAPVASNIGRMVAEEDAGWSYNLKPHFVDFDGAVLTFSLGAGSPSWLQINPATGKIYGTPGNAAVGLSSVTVIATDQDGATVSSTFTINVENTNDAPIVTPLSDQVINEGCLVSYNISKNFKEIDAGDSLTYSLSDDAPDWLTINPNSGILTGMLTEADVSTVPVTVIATDKSGASSQMSFDLTVNGIPTATPVDDMTLNEGTLLSFNVSDHFSDADGIDSLMFSLDKDAPSWLSINTSTGLIYGSPSNSDVGTKAVKVIAKDAHGVKANTVFKITVDNTNDAPTVTPITDQMTDEDSPFSFDISSYFQDVDAGDSLTYLFGGTAPAWLVLNADTGMLSGTPDNGDVGDHTFSVIATDQSGVSVETSFTISVNNVNDIPMVTFVDNMSVNEDETWTYDIAPYFFDPDLGDALSFSATLADDSPLPSWLNFDTITGVFSGAPVNGDVGSIDVKVIAIDGTGASAEDTFTITVNNLNDAPIVTPIEDASVTEGSVWTLGLSTYFSDSNIGDTMVYSATLVSGDPLPSWMMLDSEFGVLTVMPKNAHVGIYNIRVEGKDSAGESVSTTFQITVNNANDAPTVSVIPDIKMDEEKVMGYDMSEFFKEIDVGDTLTYSLGGTTPVWVIIDSQTGIITATPPVGSSEIYTIQVIATDTSGETASQEFKVTVLNMERGTGVNDIFEDARADEGYDDIDGDDYIVGNTFAADSLTGTSGGDDTIYGGLGDDTIVFDSNDTFVDGGSGYDTLHILEADADLFLFPAINFEEIYLDGAMGNTLALDEQDVLDLSSGTNLKISGDATDTIELSGNWVMGSDQGDYTTFTSGSASVEVDNTIVDAGGVTLL